MNILIITIGTRGDVQPYVALGKGLKAAGHDVTICTSDRFEDFVLGHGLSFAYLNDELLKLLDTVEGRGAVEDLGSFFSGIKTGLKLLKEVKPIGRALISDGWEAARAVDPDIIVYHPKMGSAIHYAEKLDVPAVLAPLFPQFVPTAEFPTIGFPNWKLGGWYNRLTYSAVLAIAGRIGGKYINEWRTANGLPRQPRGTDVLHTSAGEHIPVLHGYSRHVLPEPADWPECVKTTGYWFLGGQEGWVPDERLKAFLEAGDPPVYVGFGSMAGRDPGRVTRIVIEALARANLRAVFATGWGGLAPESVGEIPETVLCVDQVPHDWLFRRVAAVVHHGGAGTTAAGLRAGCPTVICPFFGDQPLWGIRVRELGAGAAPIPQKKVTAEKLAAALVEVTTDLSIRENAEVLGEKIRGEDGVREAVRMLEAFA